MLGFIEIGGEAGACFSAGNPALRADATATGWGGSDGVSVGNSQHSVSSFTLHTFARSCVGLGYSQPSLIESVVCVNGRLTASAPLMEILPSKQ
jgi:hypothetical protein